MPRPPPRAAGEGYDPKQEFSSAAELTSTTYKDFTRGTYLPAEDRLAKLKEEQTKTAAALAKAASGAINSYKPPTGGERVVVTVSGAMKGNYRDKLLGAPAEAYRDIQPLENDLINAGSHVKEAESQVRALKNTAESLRELGDRLASLGREFPTLKPGDSAARYAVNVEVATTLAKNLSGRLPTDAERTAYRGVAERLGEVGRQIEQQLGVTREDKAKF